MSPPSSAGSQSSILANTSHELIVQDILPTSPPTPPPPSSPALTARPLTPLTLPPPLDYLSVLDDATSIAGTILGSDVSLPPPHFPSCVLGDHLEPYPALRLDGSIRPSYLASIPDLSRFNWSPGMYYTDSAQRPIPGTEREYRWVDDTSYVLRLHVIHPPLSSGYFLFFRSGQFYLGKQVRGSETIRLNVPSP